MNRKNRTLAFLAKNYHPFTQFTFEMLKGAGDALRIFEIKAGETFSIRTSSTQDDSVFVIEGMAYFSDDTGEKQTVASAQIEKQPILFKNKIEITTDSSATVCHVDTTLIYEYLSLKELSDSS